MKLTIKKRNKRQALIGPIPKRPNAFRHIMLTLGVSSSNLIPAKKIRSEDFIKMTVKLREYGEDSCEIVGSLNGREVICLTFIEGEWIVDMSRNLPLKLADAREHIAVFNVVLAEADRWQELRG